MREKIRWKYEIYFKLRLIRPLAKVEIFGIWQQKNQILKPLLQEVYYITQSIYKIIPKFPGMMTLSL